MWGGSFSTHLVEYCKYNIHICLQNISLQAGQILIGSVLLSIQHRQGKAK